MSWDKPSHTLVTLFDRLCPGPPVLRRTVFGCPAAFLNGNLFFGVFGDKLWVRLDDANRARLLSIPGSDVLELAPGQPMAEYAVLPKAWLQDLDRLRAWIALGQAHAETLVPQRPR